MAEVGRVTDGQGNVVIVGTDGERVTLQTHGTVDLTADLTELFAWYWVSACRQVTTPRSVSDRKECGCGPDDMCAACAPSDEAFATAIMTALSAEIRDQDAGAP